MNETANGPPGERSFEWNSLTYPIRLRTSRESRRNAYVRTFYNWPRLLCGQHSVWTTSLDLPVRRHRKTTATAAELRRGRESNVSRTLPHNSVKFLDTDQWISNQRFNGRLQRNVIHNAMNKVNTATKTMQSWLLFDIEVIANSRHFMCTRRVAKGSIVRRDRTKLETGRRSYYWAKNIPKKPATRTWTYWWKIKDRTTLPRNEPFWNSLNYSAYRLANRLRE